MQNNQECLSVHKETQSGLDPHLPGDPAPRGFCVLALYGRAGGSAVFRASDHSVPSWPLRETGATVFVH